MGVYYIQAGHWELVRLLSLSKQCATPMNVAVSGRGVMCDVKCCILNYICHYSGRHSTITIGRVIIGYSSIVQSSNNKPTKAAMVIIVAMVTAHDSRYNSL